MGERAAQKIVDGVKRDIPACGDAQPAAEHAQAGLQSYVQIEPHFLHQKPTVLDLPEGETLKEAVQATQQDGVRPQESGVQSFHLSTRRLNPVEPIRRRRARASDARSDLVS